MALGLLEAYGPVRMRVLRGVDSKYNKRDHLGGNSIQTILLSAPMYLITKSIKLL